MELTCKRMNDLDFKDIVEGTVYQFTREITRDDGVKFADITGDLNPSHVDQEFGEKSRFGQNIVHGMLVGSLFSTLVGMHCPGKKCLYLSQTLNFRAPLFYGTIVTVRGTVVGKNEAIRMITLKTEAINDGKICINGEAKVKVLT